MLHGRQNQTAALDDMLGGLRRSRSAVLVLRGDPGVGKSSLLEYAEQRAMASPVLRSTGIQSELRLPFAALHQLLYPVLDRLDDLPAPQASSLRTALGLGSSFGEDRFLTSVATLTLLAEVAAPSGLLCLIDDAQWLDRASTEALTFAARRLKAEGVVMLFAARDDGDGAFDGAGLPEMHVQSLDARESADLLTEFVPQISPRVRDRLVELTAGNPLALVEAVSVVTPDALTGREPLPDPLPLGPDVERVFTRRADGLSEGARAFLLLAAADDTGALSLIVAAAATNGVPTEALWELERAGLVSVVASAVRFRHPLVRSAVYRGATFSDRQAAHLALAASIDVTEPDGADRRAWHLAAAAVAPSDAIAADLEASAERAQQRGGVAAAAAALERSAALTETHVDKGRRLLAAAMCAWTAGQQQWSRTLLERAEPLVADPQLRGQLLHLRGLWELRCGTPQQAYPLLVDSAAADATPDARLQSLVLAGEAAAAAGDPGWTIEVGALAEAVPASTASDELMVQLLSGGAAMLRGDLALGAERLRNVIDKAETLTDPVQLLWAARAALYLGDEERACAIYVPAIERARAASAVGLLASLLARLAMSDAIAGRPAEAIANASEGLRLGRETGLEADSGIALFALALAHAVRGDEGGCHAFATQAQEVASARHLAMIADGARWSLGLLDLTLGRPSDALSRFQTSERTDNDRYPMRFLNTADLVEAAVRSGKPDACRSQFAAYEAWADRTALPARLALVARCRGLLADGQDAFEHYETALALHAASDATFQRARTQLLYGEALRRAKRRSEARPQLRAACEAFERLRADPWAERARQELRATGEAARKRDPSTLNQLTPQELQIARLARGGDSNREIAAQLFLSPRTVEYHLHKVFTKLGVTARGQLMRMDLAPPV